MDQELLVEEQIEAGEQFARDFNDYAPVDAAFWINSADTEGWYFYIASSQIEHGNIREAYGEVLRLAGTDRNQWLDAFHVKLLTCEDPLAVKVIEIRNRYPLAIPTRYNGSSIAGMEIGGAYIYPPIAAPSAAP